MDSTSVNLLDRLRHFDADEDWNRFVELYAPLLFYWAKQHGLDKNDAADFVQDILAALVTQLRTFQYDKNKRFRAWLHTVTLNRARDWHRRRNRQPNLVHCSFDKAVGPDNSADLFEEAEYRAYLVARAKHLISGEFEPATWRACWAYVAEGRTAADVGQELGMSANAVRAAKCRVLKRLKSELAGFLD